MHEEVFCENCNRWAENLDFNLPLTIEDKDFARKLIESDVTKLLELPVHTDSNSDHLKVNLHQCSKCSNTCTIDVDYLSYSTSDKGEIKEKSEDISKVYVLDSHLLNRFISKKPIHESTEAL
jgi:hypothetical protein